MLTLIRQKRKEGPGRMIVYANNGNDLVLSMVPQGALRVLDVGCGRGDNARRLKERDKRIRVVGITRNPYEAALALSVMDAIHVLDLELELSSDEAAALGTGYDLILLSHVLEHLREPVHVLRRLLSCLRPGGHVIIAVPNTLEWRTRVRFLRGSFQYTDDGILDRTHLRFFTYETAPRELVDPIPELSLLARAGTGSVPLGPIRHIRPLRGLCAKVDALGVLLAPNLFAAETVMLAQKRPLTKAAKNGWCAANPPILR